MSFQQMSARLQAMTADARSRLVTETDDPDEIIVLLGGSFRITDEFTVQGGHRTRVLTGRNRREAVIHSTAGRVTGPVQVFEPRVRRVS